MLTLALLAAGLTGTPTDSPVSWSVRASPMEDGTVRVELTAHVTKGWHLYATQLPGDLGPLPTVIRFHESEAFEVLGELNEPPPVQAYDPNFGMMVHYHSGAPRFWIRIRPNVEGVFQVEGDVEYMVCDDRTCLPPVLLPFRIAVDLNGLMNDE